MRQILQDLRTGNTAVAEVPAPRAEEGHLLIETRRSLVSAGTERMLRDFGRASLLQKARMHPDKVREAIAKIRTDGLVPTVEAIFRKLDEPLPLGYCNAGEVIGVGDGVAGFAVGDRVASNGPHAELVSVPANLAAKIPAGVSYEQAAFTIVGAIALQGIRLARPEMGETVAVIGLGLIGQLTAQLLKAAGCRVIGYDFDRPKVELARSFRIDAFCVNQGDPVAHGLSATGGRGVDAVMITASTQSDEVIAQAARLSRKRGRIVLVGVVGLKINRSDFYEKELTFQVSCSYGPGRYEDGYEEKGLDYPFGLVRWTENRNFQAVLAALEAGTLKVEPLITLRVPLTECGRIYSEMGGLASLLTYEGGNPASRSHTLVLQGGKIRGGGSGIAIVGAGNFTKMTVLPALKAGRAAVRAIVSAGGVTGSALARKYGIPISSTDLAAVLADPDVRGVIISTRHHLHARQAIEALRAGKHVLVEKPLCLRLSELEEIESEVARLGPGGPTISVGYNRRFSPHVEKIKQLLGDGAAPIAIVATMNAGAIPPQHWVHDPEMGGGRLLGEACHLVDLAAFLAGSPITEVCTLGLEGDPRADSASVLLRHANGSTAVVNYFANGHPGVSKERIEIHGQGRSLLLDNFRELKGHGFRSFSTLKTRLDKGHARQFALFAERLQAGGPALIPWPEVANSTRAALAAVRSRTEGGWVKIAGARDS